MLGQFLGRILIRHMFRFLVKVEVGISNRILIKTRSGLESTFDQDFDQNRIRFLVRAGVRISIRCLIKFGSGLESTFGQDCDQNQICFFGQSWGQNCEHMFDQIQIRFGVRVWSEFRSNSVPFFGQSGVGISNRMLVKFGSGLVSKFGSQC